MKNLTILTALLTCASAMNAQSTFRSSLPVKPRKGVTVAGTVECDGKPVAGVVVSDGYELTKPTKKVPITSSQKQNPQVFITSPPDTMYIAMMWCRSSGQTSLFLLTNTNATISVLQKMTTPATRQSSSPMCISQTSVMMCRYSPTIHRCDPQECGESQRPRHTRVHAESRRRLLGRLLVRTQLPYRKIPRKPQQCRLPHSRLQLHGKP